MTEKPPVDPQDPRHAEAFSRLLRIMNELREGCPWDRKQTMETLRTLSIEEVYELSDAILENDRYEVRKELGDLLLHIVFYARIGAEDGDFDISDVLHGICDKLVRRHPHIYGDVQAEDADAVKRNWELIKLQEQEERERQGGKPKKKTVLGGVPKSLPAMVKALRIQEKARGVGFDWPDEDGPLDKVIEEVEELKEAEGQSAERAEEEFGDLLFSLVNYARHRGIDPETALERANKKFTARFNRMESDLGAAGERFGEHLGVERLETYWQAAKRALADAEESPSES